MCLSETKMRDETRDGKYMSFALLLTQSASGDRTEDGWRAAALGWRDLPG